MKRLTRLAAASSILFSAPLLALESLDDTALAETLGQAGVTISVTPPAGGISFSTVIHDSDAAIDGAIVLGRPLALADHIATSINTGGNPITILLDATGDVDAGTAGNQASLGINITIPAGTVINTGTLSAAQSNGPGVAISNQTGVIINNMTITLPGTTVLDMTLGNEVATNGQMMRVTTNMTSGLSVSNFAIRDANAVNANGTAIRADSIAVTNASAANLNVDARVNVVPTGLQTTLTQFGSASGVDIRMTNLRMGDTTTSTMGNLNILGLNMNGSVLRLYGH